MRSIILACLSLSTCVGCGISNKFCESNADTLNGFCETIVGYDTELESKVDNLNTQLNFLNQQREHEIAGLAEALLSSQADLTQLSALVSTNTDNIGLVMNQVFLLDQNVANALYYIASIQSQIETMQARLTEIATRTDVVSTVDFCGDSPSRVDEVGLRLSTGELVVFFTGDGGNRLSVLGPGNYRVTDKTNCCFDVDSNNNVINERSCQK